MIKRNLFSFLGLVGLTFGILSCSGSATSTDSGDTEADATSSGAAVAALFSSGEEAQLNKGTMQRLANLIATEVKAQEEGDEEEGGEEEGDGEERNTCDDPDGDGEGDGPEEVSVGFSGEAGTYGDPSANAIEVTADDFCQDADGTENEGDDLFATYELTSTVTGTCDSGTLEMTAGEGVWRNTDDCFPQIYGTFTINGTEVDCYMCLSEDGSPDDGSCSNISDGSAVTLNADDSCTIGEGTDEEDIGDGEAEGEDEEDLGEDEEDLGDEEE